MNLIIIPPKSYPKSRISTLNSTNQELGIGQAYTGTWEEVIDYAEVIATIDTTENSETDGLKVQWSFDGVTVHGEDVYTISPTSSKTFSFPCQNRYFRMRYVNNGTAQTSFNLISLLKIHASKGSSHRLKDPLSQEDDAIVVASLIKGFSTAGGGQIVDVKVSPSGAIQVGGDVGLIDAKAEDTPHVSGDKGIMMLAIRSDSDVATADNGDYTALKLDENGRLKVSTQPASYTDGSGNITAKAQTISLNVDRASNVTISMVATSLVGHNATFEYSNNSTNGTDGTWYGIQVVRSNANTVESTTGVLAATPAYGWKASVNAYKWVRVRATAHTSGTAAYIIKQGAYATEPIPAIQVTGTQAVSGTVTASAATYSIPVTVADVASAALTTTTTTAAITPASGQAFTVNIPVTAVTGTNPTLDVSIEESDDSGTNWRRIYEFPRITATGFYSSPPLFLQGNRLRYVQTVSGTTPSFTRAINRLQRNESKNTYRQRIDRTISPTTLNATSVVLETLGATNVSLIVNMGAAATPPQFKIQGSDDNVNFYELSPTALVTVASSTVKMTIQGECPRYVRAIETTAGVTATLGYLLLKAW